MSVITSAPRLLSKKPSGAHSTPKPHSLPDLVSRSQSGPSLVADPLHQAGVDVPVHDDHFRRDAEDEEWLREVGHRRWYVL
jgi:hypothetical protein